MGTTSPIASSTATWGRDTTNMTPKFDGRDRLRLSEELFLIRGENAYFLEVAGSGLDVPIELISEYLNFDLINDHSGPKSVEGISALCTKADNVANKHTIFLNIARDALSSDQRSESYVEFDDDG
jgi:hypothetical protein